MNDQRWNQLVLIGVVLGAAIVTGFVAALMSTRDAGAIAQALGNVIGGMVGAGGAAIAVGWQLRADRLRREGDAADFRQGISDELMVSTAELLTARSALLAMSDADGPQALEAGRHWVQITTPALFAHAGDRLYLLRTAERAALTTYYDDVDNVRQVIADARALLLGNSILWPVQLPVVKDAVRIATIHGAEAVAALFGREKHPREARLRDQEWIDEPARMGARYAIQQARERGLAVWEKL